VPDPKMACQVMQVSKAIIAVELILYV